MKYSKQLLFLAFIALVAIAACKNDDEESPDGDRTAQLIGKNWKVTSIKGTTDNPTFSSLSIDIFNNKLYVFGQETSTGNYDLPTFPECAKDNIITFKTDKTYTVSEGASSCDESYFFNITQGTWAFSNNEETLILTDQSGAVFNYNIVSMSEQSIDGETAGEFSYGGENIDYTITTTFTAQ